MRCGSVSLCFDHISFIHSFCFNVLEFLLSLYRYDWSAATNCFYLRWSHAATAVLHGGQ